MVRLAKRIPSEVRVDVHGDLGCFQSWFFPGRTRAGSLCIFTHVLTENLGNYGRFLKCFYILSSICPFRRGFSPWSPKSSFNGRKTRWFRHVPKINNGYRVIRSLKDVIDSSSLAPQVMLTYLEDNIGLSWTGRLTRGCLGRFGRVSTKEAWNPWVTRWLNKYAQVFCILFSAISLHSIIQLLDPRQTICTSLAVLFM